MDVSFGKMSIYFLSSFIYWTFFVIEFYGFLYFLDINSLSSVRFPNVFFHSVDGFFIFFIVSLAVQKLFRGNSLILIFQ